MKSANRVATAMTERRRMQRPSIKVRQLFLWLRKGTVLFCGLLLCFYSIFIVGLHIQVQRAAMKENYSDTVEGEISMFFFDYKAGLCAV